MSIVGSIAASGLRASLESFETAASHIAHRDDRAPGFQSPAAEEPSGNDGVTVAYASSAPAYNTRGVAAAPGGDVAAPPVDLALALVNIAMAVQVFNANVAVARTTDDMAKATLDIVS